MYKRWEWGNHPLRSFLIVDTERDKTKHHLRVFTRFRIPYIPYRSMPWVFDFRYMYFDFEDLEDENLTQG